MYPDFYSNLTGADNSGSIDDGTIIVCNFPVYTSDRLSGDLHHSQY